MLAEIFLLRLEMSMRGSLTRPSPRHPASCRCRAACGRSSRRSFASEPRQGARLADARRFAPGCFLTLRRVSPAVPTRARPVHDLLPLPKIQSRVLRHRRGRCCARHRWRSLRRIQACRRTLAAARGRASGAGDAGHVLCDRLELPQSRGRPRQGERPRSDLLQDAARRLPRQQRAPSARRRYRQTGRCRTALRIRGRARRRDRQTGPQGRRLPKRRSAFSAGPSATISPSATGRPRTRPICAARTPIRSSRWGRGSSPGSTSAT